MGQNVESASLFWPIIVVLQNLPRRTEVEMKLIISLSSGLLELQKKYRVPTDLTKYLSMPFQ